MLRFITFFEVKSAKLLPNHCWSTYQRGSKYFKTYFEVFGLGAPKVFGPPGVHLFQRGSKYFRIILKYMDRGGPNTSRYLDQGEPFGGGPFFHDSPPVHIRVPFYYSTTCNVVSLDAGDNMLQLCRNSFVHALMNFPNQTA